MKKTCTKSRWLWARFRRTQRNLCKANFPTMLERISYRGWDSAYRLSNGVVELVLTADVGPRILFYGFRNGENLLHEVAEEAGKTGGCEFRLYGGHPPRAFPAMGGA